MIKLPGELLIYNSASKGYSPMWQWRICIGNITIKSDHVHLKENIARKSGLGWAKLLHINIEKERRWEL